jgi:hypothetical protein
LASILLRWYLPVPYNDCVGTDKYHNPRLATSHRNAKGRSMIAILSALTLLAATWLRKRTAAAKPAQFAQKRAVS